MIPNKLQQVLLQAHERYGSQQFREAETLYRWVLARDSANGDALQSLVAICLQTQRLDEAEQFLKQLVDSYPEEPSYTNHYANALMQRGDMEAVIACFNRLLEKQPGLAESHYNYALLLKRGQRYDMALEHYQKALALGIDDPEEVYSNISVIHSDQHRHEEAQAVLDQALAINPNYIPALYNLAQLQEEWGDLDQARHLFKKILELDPNHLDALVRLAHVRAVTKSDDPLIGLLKTSLEGANNENLAQENLHFALGKVYDDCSRFDDAFEHYRQGNEHSQRRAGNYDPPGHEKIISELIQTFSQDWLASVEAVSDTSLIFICGMFRSGSTLLEQMLAAHPELTSGGEINFFNTQVPLPEALDLMHRPWLQELGEGYLEYITHAFRGSAHVVNKRPDNFLYLGLIRALFPNARIIHTLRQPLDNCLSVYFQQLTTPFSYANKLMDIGHYYVQYRRLMSHWQQTFPGKILHVNYDSLVQEPRTVVEPLIHSLGLEWHENCLNFQTVANRVRTASVWQVRQPLHQKSSGRWRHYEPHLDSLQRYLLDADLCTGA